ncbi:flagellar export protein FliJ [Bythopirellula polymerisocia]|uniref:Flagellar FliJ protein n=1 Tax=Bythopirellula polymerisocia TaxID=2528003 RepID=A0A5C6CTE7_9BACT|nr:flagellar export protein FliJ [Bythopirellula polymerisocia]TWU27802.1 Flagellar FliJ protein [Bythopirellula polymerisocia]
MARFRFRLATLEKLREIHRDELRLKLAEAIQAHQILEQQLGQVGDELAELEASRRAAVVGGVTDVNGILTAQRYQAVLLAQQKTMREQSRILAEESEQRRQSVVEADRQVKVLDKLRTRQLADHQQQARLTETKLLDEVASRCQQEDSAWVH